jgi:hypothetical protein
MGPEHDVFRNRKYASFKFGPNSLRQPIREFGALLRFFETLDPIANFSEQRTLM